MSDFEEVKEIYDDWCVYTLNQGSPTHAILTLPGRGGHGHDLCHRYLSCGLENVLFVGITPKDFEWYPMPHGAWDQDNAIEGQVAAFVSISEVLDEIEAKHGIPWENVAITGFSAGAVMALYMASRSDRRFAGIVSHSGAILDSENWPFAKTDTPILVQHNQDDMDFEWLERYVPMKDALISKGYKAHFVERKHGHHIVHYPDIVIAGQFLSKKLGYPTNWRHENVDMLNPKILEW